MSHEIDPILDRTLSTKGSEWHGLAKQVEAITPELLKEEGIFFPITQGTVLNSLHGAESFQSVLARLTNAVEGGNSRIALDALKTLNLAQIGTHKNIIADMRGIRPDLETEEYAMGLIPLHVTKKSYEVITNERVYEVISKAFEKCPITSAGTLQGLQVFFMSLDIGDNLRKGPRGDVFMQNMTALTSHNGTLGTRFFDSSVRVVCMNTVRASLSNRGLLDFTVYHTKGAQAALDKVSNDLEAVMKARNEYFEGLSLLDTIPCDVATARHLFIAYTAKMAEEKGADLSKYEISTQVYNRAEEIAQLFVRGKGNAGANLYDGYNALTECFTHGTGTGKSASEKDKFTASLFGTAADIKEGYLPFLLSPADVLAGYNDLGARLLADYAQRKA